jgi:hypothetical protein
LSTPSSCAADGRLSRGGMTDARDGDDVDGDVEAEFDEDPE